MSTKRRLEIAKSLARFYPPETFERIFEEAQKEAEAIDYSSLSSSGIIPPPIIAMSFTPLFSRYFFTSGKAVK